MESNERKMTACALRELLNHATLTGDPSLALTQHATNLYQHQRMNATTDLLAAEDTFLKGGMRTIHEKIALRAYLKAEQRGFAPGHALDDWLEAEAEILAEEAITHLQPDE